MSRRVLVLAPDTDPHASAVVWALQQQGIGTTWVPALPAGPEARYAFHIDAAEQVLGSPVFGGDRPRSVWNRRLHDPEPYCAESDRGFARWEWRLFQRNLFYLEGAFGDALWVNPLAAAQRAEHKLLQLSACRRWGIAFPETLVTNDASEVDAFRRRCGLIIFKSFLIHQWEDRDSGRKYAVGVSVLDERSPLPEAAVAVAPGIYQRYIDKVMDVRVTMIGERAFAMGLRRASGGAFVDWRPHTGDADMVAEPVDLPAELEARLHTLMRSLGLVFGCIDLVVDRQGQFHFLEVNQAGQFLFMEELLPEYPVLATMASLLAGDRGEAKASTAISMAGFRASDAYAELRERVMQRPAGERTHPELFSLE